MLEMAQMRSHLTLRRRWTRIMTALATMPTQMMTAMV